MASLAGEMKKKRKEVLSDVVRSKIQAERPIHIHRW
jgi:hypothetical protein